jgi:hypothetical protein
MKIFSFLSFFTVAPITVFSLPCFAFRVVINFAAIVAEQFLFPASIVLSEVWKWSPDSA